MFSLLCAKIKAVRIETFRSHEAQIRSHWLILFRSHGSISLARIELVRTYFFLMCGCAQQITLIPGLVQIELYVVYRQKMAHLSNYLQRFFDLFYWVETKEIQGSFFTFRPIVHTIFVPGQMQ